MAEEKRESNRQAGGAQTITFKPYMSNKGVIHMMISFFEAICIVFRQN